MSIQILMPALSPTMKEGILQKWLVKIGDEVKAGDVLAEIETDKATMELEAVDEGIITNILVEEGTQGVSVNSPIAILNGSEKDNIEDNINENKSEIEKNNVFEQKVINKKNNLKSIKQTVIKKNSNIIASPYAKKFSKDKNINLISISGSGPKGRIIKRDFLKLEKIEQPFQIDVHETMFHPHSNFKDAKNWVILEETGEIRPWPWHYDAAHFKLLKNGKILHNHPSPKTYSAIVRQGEDANNFFKEEEKMDIQKGERREIRIGERKEYGRIGKDLSYFSPRKRKYRRKKYKNSKNRKKIGF